MGVTAMNSKEKAQQSARLLVDAFSNSTHIWNDNVETSPKAQDEEINRETFLKAAQGAATDHAAALAQDYYW